MAGPSSIGVRSHAVWGGLCLLARPSPPRGGTASSQEIVMSASLSSVGTAIPGPSLQQCFLALLPRIERHAHIYFRHVVCPVQKADCLAETVALCWMWFL